MVEIEFMVEKLWPTENSVMAHYWAMAHRLKTSVLEHVDVRNEWFEGTSLFCDVHAIACAANKQ